MTSRSRCPPPPSRPVGARSALGRCGCPFALLERHLGLVHVLRLADRPRPLELIPHPPCLFGLATATPHQPVLAHAQAPPGDREHSMVLLEHCDRKWEEALQLERRSAARVADPLPSTADAARRRYRRQTPIEVPRLI